MLSIIIGTACFVVFMLVVLVWLGRRIERMANDEIKRYEEWKGIGGR